MDNVQLKRTSNISINALPAGLVGNSICKLSMIDRLRCERVSPRWFWVIRKFVWTDVKKLDRSTVFEGRMTENIHREEMFWGNEPFKDGIYNLISLFNRVAGPNIVELNLYSFGHHHLSTFAPKIIGSLTLFPKLEKLNIGYLDLAAFVNKLPETLRKLQTYHTFSANTLEILSINCPYLEFIPFYFIDDKNIEILEVFIPKFPRQKELYIGPLYIREKKSLSSICTLKELEMLSILKCNGLDEHFILRIAINCKRLKWLRLHNSYEISEASFNHLTKICNLEILEIYASYSYYYGGVFNGFTDSVLKTIAERKQLKKLLINKSHVLTDHSIVYLVNQCKSLVSLDLFGCSKITERSLESVIAEVHRRHGNPLRMSPIISCDNEIFFFNCKNTGIDIDKAHQLTAKNPWLTIDYDSRFINFW